MAYLALYRRFRPTDFDNVIGQDAIVKTLTNQIKTDKIGHAYLFCGARGTGKTSLAKIFSKAVNCLSPVNGSPCGQCEACKALADPSNIDIVEMDAASNNKVENVREIRENIQYAPVGVRYKVYIIDEVHMLTPEAFNALLKTLEEPPKHAVFILATTEPNKLPATILSRCMRFDFKLIPTPKLKSLVMKIYDEIGKKYTDEAVTLIAKSGEGSVRDTLSVADLCVSVGDGELTYDEVLSVLGATDIRQIDKIIRSVFLSDVGELLTSVDYLISSGKSIGVLSKDLTNYLRDLLIVKKCSNAKDILALPDDVFNEYLTTANLAVDARIMRSLEIVSSIENGLKFSTQPRAVLETALIKASMPEQDYDLGSIIARLEKVENDIKNGDITVKAVETPTVKVVEKIVEKVIEKPVEVEKPIEKPQTAESKKSETADDFYPFDISELDAPPVMDGYSDEVIGIKTEKKVEPVKPVTVSKTVQSGTTTDGRKIWGNIVRKFRNMPNKMILWVACQEMTATVEGTTLKIITNEEKEEELLKRPENFSTIQEVSSTFGITRVEVVGKNPVQGENLKEKVNEFFKGTIN